MKIGFDAKRIFCNFRGLGNFSRTLVESLIRFHPEHDYYLFTPEIKDERAKHWLSQFDDINVILPEKAIEKVNKSLWRTFQIHKRIDELGLDVYHGLSHELPWSIDKTKCKSVVTIHDLIFMRYPEYFPYLDRQVYKKKFSHSIDHADKVISICEQTKRDIVSYLGGNEEKIEVHYQSSHPRFYDINSEQENKEITKSFNLPEKYFLYVGALEERKNALTLLRAFEKIQDSVEESLVLVGRGKKYKEKIENYIQNHNLQKRVLVLGNVEDHHLPSFYQMATAFIFPSFFEGWGIPIVDALFSETPVITSRGSCFPESGGPHSLYVNPESVDDLSQAILRLKQNEELRHLMTREGRHYAEQFHWRQTSTKLIDLYERLLISN